MARAKPDPKEENNQPSAEKTINQSFSLLATSTDRASEVQACGLPNTPFYQIAGPRPLPFYFQGSIEQQS